MNLATTTPWAHSYTKKGLLFITALVMSSFLMMQNSPKAHATKASDAPSGPAWDAVLSEHEGTPPRIIAVDKVLQRLYVLERQGSQRMARDYVCTTGQAVGDKLVEGDLKTPEGVYFVVQHLNSGLDYVMYGNEAYTLNYPNPVDKLRRKTGYGIWIHGRGEALYPLQTQGCVAMENTDLARIGKILIPGTPVTLTSTYSQKHEPTKQDIQTAGLLRKRVEAWAEAWANRSKDFFDFYNKDAYGIAQGESFSAFQWQKEHLFRVLPWVKTTVHDIQVLPGPGYWVTWFYQDYSAPNLSTTGVRRLYWMATPQGDYKIVGMEWLPGQKTTTQLAADDYFLRGTDEGKPAQLLASVDGKRAPYPAGKEAPTPVASAAQHIPSTGKDHRENPTQGEMAHPSREAALEVLTASTAEKAPIVVAEAPQAEQLPEVFGLPPALPSQRLGSAWEYNGVPVSAPIKKLEKEPEPAVETVAVAVVEEKPEPQPEVTPVVTEAPKADQPSMPSGQALETASINAIAANALIENWRSAWEAGDVDAYMSYYAKNAVQAPRTGAAAIRKQKQALWLRSAPKTVELDDITLSIEGDTIEARMEQHYTDSKGGGDVGIKTLILKHIDGNWLIVKETWKAIQ